MRSDSWTVRIWKLFYPLLIHFSISMMVSLIFSTIALTMGNGSQEASIQLVMEYNFPVTLVTDGIILFILIYFFKKDSIRLIPVKMKIKVIHWIVLVICGASACLAVNYLISFSGIIQLFYEQYEEVSNLLYYGPIWQELILMVVAAPVLEEFLFRGLIYRRLRTYCTFPVALVVSALLFGVYHGNVVQGIYAFLLGAVMAYVYERFRTILAPIIFHASANLMSVLVTEILQVSDFFDSNAGIVMIITGIIVIGMIYLIQNNLRPKEELT